MPIETDRSDRPDRLERLGHRLRWLLLVWIIGAWVNFLYQAKVIGALGSRMVRMLVS